MAQTYKALSLLLTYPDAEIRAGAGELRAVIEAEGLVHRTARKRLAPLFDALAGEDLLELQERYVFLFDRTRSLSLHLFEHVHGESRDRGQAMVDLMNLYEQNGLEIGAHELPDYLPLFLEFLSTLPAADARDLLQQPLHIVSALRERLDKRDSPYAGVFAAIESVAAANPDTAQVREILDAKEDDDPDDLEALDAAWEDEPVTFGNSGDGGCGPDRLRTRLRAARRAPPPPQDGHQGD